MLSSVSKPRRLTVEIGSITNVSSALSLKSVVPSVRPIFIKPCVSMNPLDKCGTVTSDNPSSNNASCTTSPDGTCVVVPCDSPMRFSVITEGIVI